MAKPSTGFKIEIIPDVYTIGLFKKTLSSRKRLRVTTGVALVSLWVAFFALGWFLHDVSEWPNLNLVLLLLLMAGLIVTSYLLALTVGDAFFPGPWREKMRDPKFVPEQIDDQVALLKNRNGYFIATWFVCLVALFFVSDRMTGSMISWYSNCGGALASLRSDDASERLASLYALTNPLRTTAWEDDGIRQQIQIILEDPNEGDDVVALAAYVAGRAIMVNTADALTAVLKNTARSEHARAEAAATLGRLDWKPARGAMITVMNQTFTQDPMNHELIPSIIYAFSYAMKDDSAVQPVMQKLETCLSTACSDEILQYGFFYLKSMRSTQAAPLAFKYIDDAQQPAAHRCWAADSLRFISEPKHIAEMKMRFDRTSRELVCADVFHKYHQEAAVVLFENDPMRSLYVRAVGNHMQPSDYDWIWVIGSDENELLSTRKVAEVYTRAMNAKK